MRSHFYRTLVAQLLLAALVISIAFGAAVWFYEIEAIDETVVDLATAEARVFADPNQDALANQTRIGERLTTFLTRRLKEADGYFVMAEVYDNDHKSLAESTVGDIQAIEAAFDRDAHPFPVDGKPHYDRTVLDGALYLRVLTDLHAGAFDGYFEGIFAVAPARIQQIEENVFATVSVVIGVVLGTTLFLLPVVIRLNRRLIRLSNNLLRANMEILEVLGGAIAKRDSDTGQHNYRVTLYALHLARALGLQPNGIRGLIKGAFLHDVGKIAISDTILLKPGKLSEDEFMVMKTHVDHGVDIVARSAWLDDATPVVAGHHEKYDGSGYPAGLAADAIPENARIFAVVDVFDALTSRRPYKEAMPFAKAMAILEEGRGRHFDPKVLDAFNRIASDLHHRFAESGEDSLRCALLAMTAEYF